ncbi:hypothetical protein C8R45DRAFT_944329 [Mycena sanguinolenta]|nr:hypothetical protein C8R45DRAFT_944329 [Mycena sanguinolenta]
MHPHLQIVLPWLWAVCSILVFGIDKSCTHGLVQLPSGGGYLGMGKDLINAGLIDVQSFQPGSCNKMGHDSSEIMLVFQDLNKHVWRGMFGVLNGHQTSWLIAVYGFLGLVARLCTTRILTNHLCGLRLDASVELNSMWYTYLKLFAIDAQRRHGAQGEAGSVKILKVFGFSLTGVHAEDEPGSLGRTESHDISMMVDSMFSILRQSI